MTKTMTAATATELKKELKSTFPGVKFSVRSTSYNMGSSISVEWNNLPTVAAVEVITNKYSHINRCEITHEILSGGNTYISTYVDYTPEFIAQVEELMTEESKNIKGSYIYTRNFNMVLDQMWKEQNNEFVSGAEVVVAALPITDQTEASNGEKENNTLNLINQINEIQGVSTVKTNMFNQHELYIDDIHVGFVRVDNNKFVIIPHFNFAINIAKPIFVSLSDFNGVIAQYREKGILYYNRSYLSKEVTTSVKNDKQDKSMNEINTNVIPELDHLSGSWVVSRIKDGSVIGEFYERSNSLTQSFV